MPEMIHYKVSQTREVSVTANSIVDAVRIAAAAFDNGQNRHHGVINGPSDVWGNTDTRIRVIDISAREEF